MVSEWEWELEGGRERGTKRLRGMVMVMVTKRLVCVCPSVVEGCGPGRQEDDLKVRRESGYCAP